jgi:hypothetical protein
MSVYAAIATVKKRLARAQAERESWRAAGNDQKYLEACSAVSALVQELAKLELAARGRTGVV